jgi:FMN reductase
VVEEAMKPLLRIAIVLGQAAPPGRLPARRPLSPAIRKIRAGVVVSSIDLRPRRSRHATAAWPMRTDERRATRSGRPLRIRGRGRSLSPRSFPGVLKNVLDLLPVGAARQAGGDRRDGGDHHYLGVDGHLRSVLAWFGRSRCRRASI